MTDNDPSISDEIERYLRTGETDPLHSAWPGTSFVERAKRAHDVLRGALSGEVRRLAQGLADEPMPKQDIVVLTRSKVEPMVRGLFPRAEQETVLATLEKSVVFLTSVNIQSLLLEERWDASAWILANLYLASIDAELLSDDAPRLVGLSEETTCYVSTEYFAEDDRFADERRTFAAEYGENVRISEERVDPAEVAAIVLEAAAARNGWKVILARCAPTSPPKPAKPKLRESRAPTETGHRR